MVIQTMSLCEADFAVNAVRLNRIAADLRAKVGRGDATVGNPHRARMFQFDLSSSNLSILVVRACPLVEIRQPVSYRAIRGNSVSVNCTLPPLTRAAGTPRLSRGRRTRSTGRATASCPGPSASRSAKCEELRVKYEYSLD